MAAFLVFTVAFYWVGPMAAFEKRGHRPGPIWTLSVLKRSPSAAFRKCDHRYTSSRISVKHGLTLRLKFKKKKNPQTLMW